MIINDFRCNKIFRRGDTEREEAEHDERIAWEEENYLYNPNEDAGDRD